MSAGSDPRGDSAGFTLLEVLIALAILAAALMMITGAQNQGIVVTRYQEQQITAATLARYKMVELELEIEKDGFPSDDKEECGNFGEDLGSTDLFRTMTPDPVHGIENYDYCWSLTKVELPLPMDMLGGGGEEGGAAGGAAGSAGMLGVDPKTVAEQLGKAVRQLKLTVKWKLGEVEQELPVVTHLVNTTQSGVL